MNTKRLFYILIPAIALAFGASLFLEERMSVVTAPTLEQGASAVVPETASISLTIGSTQYTLPLTRETTIAEVMEQMSANGLSFTTREFPGLGAFVDEINGKRGLDGHYWILHINGKKSGLGISQAVIRPGDRIEWRYEKGY